jgi:hypothetical protein
VVALRRRNQQVTDTLTAPEDIPPGAE